MSIERYLRLIAGFFVMLSVALGYWVNPRWFLFTAFVGLNLFQSAFTNWCPMMTSCGNWGSNRRSAASPAMRRAADMSGYWILGLFVAYFVLLRWVLPRFGVPT